MIRYVALLVGCALAAVAVWHPAPRPAIEQSLPAPRPTRSPRVPRPLRSQEVSLVYVVGEVARPGLYRASAASRAADLVRAAGGMLVGADPAGINLAAHVADGDEIVVPRVGEAPSRHKTVRQARPRTRSKADPLSPVDINAGDTAALASVPGIGPTLAQRIVALRRQQGPYASLDELLDVAGMSPSRLARAQAFLLVR